MELLRRHPAQTLLALVLLAAMTVAGAAAQVPDHPDHPTDEPQMLDIPEADNPAVAARNALMEGRGALKDAEKYLARASEEQETKKREKLEERAQKAYDTAAEQFMLAVQYDNELAEAYAGLGRAWLATGQKEQALQAWGTAQKHSPKDPEILFGLGHCLVELDRVSDAAQVYVMLEKQDTERAAELLDVLRAWGEPRLEEGNKVAEGLMAWIEQQG